MEELNRICEELARIAKALGADEPEIAREAEHGNAVKTSSLL